MWRQLTAYVRRLANASVAHSNAWLISSTIDINVQNWSNYNEYIIRNYQMEGEKSFFFTTSSAHSVMQRNAPTTIKINT